MSGGAFIDALESYGFKQIESLRYQHPQFYRHRPDLAATIGPIKCGGLTNQLAYNNVQHSMPSYQPNYGWQSIPREFLNPVYAPQTVNIDLNISSAQFVLNTRNSGSRGISGATLSLDHLRESVGGLISDRLSGISPLLNRDVSNNMSTHLNLANAATQPSSSSSSLIPQPAPTFSSIVPINSNIQQSISITKAGSESAAPPSSGSQMMRSLTTLLAQLQDQQRRISSGPQVIVQTKTVPSSTTVIATPSVSKLSGVTSQAHMRNNIGTSSIKSVSPDDVVSIPYASMTDVPQPVVDSSDGELASTSSNSCYDDSSESLCSTDVDEDNVKVVRRRRGRKPPNYVYPSQNDDVNAKVDNKTIVNHTYSPQPTSPTSSDSEPVNIDSDDDVIDLRSLPRHITGKRSSVPLTQKRMFIDLTGAHTDLTGGKGKFSKLLKEIRTNIDDDRFVYGHFHGKVRTGNRTAAMMLRPITNARRRMTDSGVDRVVGGLQVSRMKIHHEDSDDVKVAPQPEINKDRKRRRSSLSVDPKSRAPDDSDDEPQIQIGEDYQCNIPELQPMLQKATLASLLLDHQGQSGSVPSSVEKTAEQHRLQEQLQSKVWFPSSRCSPEAIDRLIATIREKYDKPSVSPGSFVIGLVKAQSNNAIALRYKLCCVLECFEEEDMDEKEREKLDAWKIAMATRHKMRSSSPDNNDDDGDIEGEEEGSNTPSPIPFSVEESNNSNGSKILGTYLRLFDGNQASLLLFAFISIE